MSAVLKLISSLILFSSEGCGTVAWKNGNSMFFLSCFFLSLHANVSVFPAALLLVVPLTLPSPPDWLCGLLESLSLSLSLFSRSHALLLFLLQLPPATDQSQCSESEDFKPTECEMSVLELFQQCQFLTNSLILLEACALMTLQASQMTAWARMPL